MKSRYFENMYPLIKKVEYLMLSCIVEQTLQVSLKKITIHAF